jgi:hypothetical protein
LENPLIKQGSSLVDEREKGDSLGEVWTNEGNPHLSMDAIAT